MGTPQLTIARCMKDPNLPVALVRDDRRRDGQLHTHEFSEIVIVLAGSGFHITERNEYPIARGDAFLIPAGRAHGYRVPRRLSIANVLFDRAALGMPLSDLTAMPGYHALFKLEPLHRRTRGLADRLRLDRPQLARAVALVDRFERESEAREPGYVLATVAIFLQLVVHLSRCYAEADAPAARPSAGVGRALGFLEGQIDRQISLAQVVRVAGMSTSSLLREFRRATGRSPIDYHLRLRLARACELLRAGERSVTEVAAAVGFPDAGYFSRRFRAAMGMAPGEYRRREAAIR